MWESLVENNRQIVGQKYNIKATDGPQPTPQRNEHLFEGLNISTGKSSEFA